MEAREKNAYVVLGLKGGTRRSLLLLHEVPVLPVQKADGRIVVVQIKLVAKGRAAHLGHLVVASDLPDDFDEGARERIRPAQARHGDVLLVLVNDWERRCEGAGVSAHANKKNHTPTRYITRHNIAHTLQRARTRARSYYEGVRMNEYVPMP